MNIVRMAAQLSLLGFLAACGGGDKGGEGKAGGANAGGAGNGAVQIDGSSTVYPITEAVAEQFRTAPEGKDVRVTVGVSGTGGGFKRFCAGEIDISDASRPIKDTEKQQCAQKGIEYVEFDVGRDGIALLVNPANKFAECLTIAELKKIWEPSSAVKKWSDVRAGFPGTDIKLFGPGTASGTFDYFTEAVNGKSGASRPDYTASENDEIILQGIEGTPGALGYVGIAYYIENKTKVKLLGLDSGKGCITPSAETIKSGEYAPLSRPLFIYVKKPALQRKEVRSFVAYYLAQAPTLVPEVGYVALDADRYQANVANLNGIK